MNPNRIEIAKSAKAAGRLLMAWFARNRRADPWRENATPYSIWVAEVMLQQTVVKAVVPYFETWMKLFPDVASLAAVKEQKVLRTWEGLGYYSRARNLHKAAKLIVTDHGGKLPSDYDQLLELPGIGEYTAAAIMSIAFGKPYPVVDANVMRVVRRILVIRDDSVAGKKRVQDFLELAIHRKEPGDFNEAMMQLGQTVCRSRQPQCEICPLRGHCQARKLGIESEIPAGKASRSLRRSSIVLVILNRGRLLTVENKTGLFAGMLTLPKIVNGGGNWEDSAREYCRELGMPEIELVAKLNQRTHLYTKYSDRLSPIVLQAKGFTGRLPRGFRWVSIGTIDGYALPSIHRKIIADYQVLRNGNHRSKHQLF